MYRVVVKSRGKYNNIVLGERYCLTKHSVNELAVMFAREECEFEVEKFIRIHSDVFAWSNYGVSEKIGIKSMRFLKEGTKMPKWSVDVYFSACKTVEVEADSWLEAREKGLEMVDDPDEEDFSVEEVECYEVREGEDEEEE